MEQTVNTIPEGYMQDRKGRLRSPRTQSTQSPRIFGCGAIFLLFFKKKREMHSNVV